MAELFARRHEKLAEKRVKIAELASGLVEDPETNVRVYNNSIQSIYSSFHPNRFPT